MQCTFNLSIYYAFISLNVILSNDSDTFYDIGDIMYLFDVSTSTVSCRCVILIFLICSKFLVIANRSSKFHYNIDS